MNFPKLIVFFLLLLNSQILLALQFVTVPEGCGIKKGKECFIKTFQDTVLHNTYLTGDLEIQKNSIVQFTQIEEDNLVQIFVIQGALRLLPKGKKNHTNIEVNGVRVSSPFLIVRRDQETLQIFDTQKFVLSEYHLRLSSSDEDQVVESSETPELKKTEFLTKVQLVQFVASYFKDKKNVLSYLKSHEASWKAEFALQNEIQTKVIARAIASEEAELKRSLEREKREKEQIKKVRELFFYRTFYR